MSFRDAPHTTESSPSVAAAPGDGIRTGRRPLVNSAHPPLRTSLVTASPQCINLCVRLWMGGCG